MYILFVVNYSVDVNYIQFSVFLLPALGTELGSYGQQSSALPLRPELTAFSSTTWYPPLNFHLLDLSRLSLQYFTHQRLPGVYFWVSPQAFRNGFLVI